MKRHRGTPNYFVVDEDSGYILEILQKQQDNPPEEKGFQ